MSSERAVNLTVALSHSVQRVKLCNAMKFQQYRNIHFSDDFSIICRHQYSVFQMHMSKLWWGDFITLLYCTYHIKVQRSTVRDSQIYLPRATRIWFSQENYVITLTFFREILYTTILDKIVNGTPGPPLPLPPSISMMPKWHVFAPSHLNHCFGGKGVNCSFLFCPRL